MTTTTLNHEELDTAASRALAEQSETLKAAIDEAREAARAFASTMTKDKIAAALGSNARGGKDALIEEYADNAASNSDAQKELTRLEVAAATDRWMAKGLNDMITAAAAASATLVEYATTPRYINWLAGQADKTVVAQHLAGHAAGVIDAVTRGYELREVVQATAGNALRKILGAVDRTDVESIAQAKAAREFLAMVARCYGHQMDLDVLTML